MEGRRVPILGAIALGVMMLLSCAHAQAAGSKSNAHACVFDTQMLATSNGVCRPHAVSYPPSVNTRVERDIYDAALMFGVPYNLLRKVAQCESGLNPKARGHGYYGLFQFAPDTFRHGAAQMARDTGVAARSYWNPHDASYVAAYLFAVGQAPSWSCTSEISP